MIDVEQRGDVWLLSMRDGENRMNRKWVDQVNQALDAVEAVQGPVALVTTGEGKFFSNGLDLDWMATGPEAGAEFLDDVHRLLGRVLGFAAVTVAAVNGHAFAAGAMLATAHDFVVMRQDRGYWCLPEVDLGLPLTPPMHAVVAAKLPRATLHEALITGRRYRAPDAAAAGIVHEVVPEHAVLDRAVQIAGGLAAKDRRVIGEHKRLTFKEALVMCARPPQDH